MDKERLRIPSDSSSGSSSRSGASPNLPRFRNSKPAYMCGGGNGVGGPPSNSPANYSPLLPSSPHNLPPPPGLPHPSLGSIYQFPNCASPPGYPSMNYPIGMTAVSGAQSQSQQQQLHGRYPPVSGMHGGHGQYQLNGFAVQNGMVQQQPPTTSPPPGYNYFGNVQQQQHHQYPAQTLPHGCSMHPNQQQTHEPFGGSSYVPYNQSGDSFELERKLSLLLNSTNSCAFDNGNSYSGDFMPSQQEDIQRDIASSHGALNRDLESKQSAKMGGVMNPIIENLVGSMSMSNGTYTHFGPSISPSNANVKAQNGQKDFFQEMSITGRQNGNSEHDRKALFSHIAVTSTKETVDGMTENFIREAVNIASKQPILAAIPQPANEIVTELKSINFNNNSNNCPAVSGPVTNKPRTSSPLDAEESSSRPQTPGKPSYLEVLTKAGLKSHQQGNHSSRKTSSTSSSPVQSSFSVSSESVPNLSHRKSVDYFIGAASTPSSSCPSSSSSPATKPRNSSSGNLLKGKENVSISAGNNYKQTGNSRNTPSNSPAHNVQSQMNKTKFQQVPMAGIERKVLSSQNSTSGGSKNIKGLKNGKVSVEKSKDVAETNEEGDCGWKTYTPRGRNNNLSSVGNKNSQKRASNGHCSSESAANSFSVMDDEDDEESIAGKSVIEDGSGERKSSSSTFGSTTSGSSTLTSTASHTRKQREKEKPRSRKEDRNCVSRRLETLAYTWLTHMISALTWLWTLITDVASLSASLGVSLMKELYIWTKTKALPNFSDKITGWQRVVRHTCHDWWNSCRTKILSVFSRGGSSSKGTEESGNSKPIRHDENILSLLGPERNISLPAGDGDEALKRLLSVKGQDPYSILGVRSDSNEETIRRYYKRQAVLVHPDKNLIVGAEEAFKILARAFEMVGDPIKRTEYHQKLMEAQAKEKFCGEIGNLLEQLRKKMEAASSTIRCTKCNSRHKKNMTDRPLFAARFCSQCRIHHGAREGELWAESGGWFGITWNYFACMDAHVWEINEWARCQKTNLKHIKADAHCVVYRLVAGGNQQNHNQHCHGANGSSFEGEDRFGAGSEADEWDSLINNLCKSAPGSTFGKTTGAPGKAGCCASGGGMNGNGSNSSSSTNQAGKRRKGKRNK